MSWQHCWFCLLKVIYSKKKNIYDLALVLNCGWYISFITFKSKSSHLISETTCIIKEYIFFLTLILIWWHYYSIDFKSEYFWFYDEKILNFLDTLYLHRNWFSKFTLSNAKNVLLKTGPYLEKKSMRSFLI